MSGRNRTRRRLPRPALALPLLLAAALTGCGISTTGPRQAGAPASGVQRPGTNAEYARLYFVGPYGLRSASRPTDRPLGPQQALDLLLEGPTDAERERGLASEVPPMNGQLSATASTGTVDVYLPMTIRDLQVTAVSQLACTAAHADVPGSRPPTQVKVRFHENLAPSTSPWTVRCDTNGNALPASE
ncbi:hypothetical protein [Streptomyces sp. NPDC087300]|uniref:hypothetical protein n=1 Tax=Streptomyces sp. NPDC087300 TaxID=3365780 RepID=UPI0038018AB7